MYLTQNCNNFNLITKYQRENMAFINLYGSVKWSSLNLYINVSRKLPTVCTIC